MLEEVDMNYAVKVGVCMGVGRNFPKEELEGQGWLLRFPCFLGMYFSPLFSSPNHENSGVMFVNTCNTRQTEMAQNDFFKLTRTAVS